MNNPTTPPQMPGLFRLDAVKRYLAARQRAELPRFGSAKLISVLWEVLLVAIGLLLAWVAEFLPNVSR